MFVGGNNNQNFCFLVLTQFTKL